MIVAFAIILLLLLVVLAMLIEQEASMRLPTEEPTMLPELVPLYLLCWIARIGKAQAQTLYKLTRVLGCNIEDLLENPMR